MPSATANAEPLLAGGVSASEYSIDSKGVRALSFLGGLGLLAVSVIHLVNIFGLVVHPIQYIANIAFIMIALFILLHETRCFPEPWRIFIGEWCKVATVPAAKPACHLLVGLLLITQSIVPVSPSFILGCYLVGVGCLMFVALLSSPDASAGR